MRLRAGIVAAAILALGLAGGLTRAQAQVWVGVEAGGLDSITEASAGGSSIVNGLGASGALGGGRAGYDWHVGNSPFFLGIQGWADWSNASFDITGNSAATINDKFGGAVRAGIMSQTGSKFYVLLGGEHTNVSYQGVLSHATGLPTSFNGLTIGGGVSMPITSNIDLGLETRFTDDKSAAITGCGGSCNATLQPRDLAVVAAVTVHLDGTSPSLAATHVPVK